MISIFKLFVRLLRRRSTQRRRTPLESVSVGVTKAQARSAAEVKAHMLELPEAKVKWVQDGDTVIVASGLSKTTIRLDSIDCPEDNQPWGDTARFGLIKLIGRQFVRIEKHGTDQHGRALATIYARSRDGADWINVNERMVALGHAWVMRRYYDHLPLDRQVALNRREAWAKSNSVGLWKTPNPIPPWQWRKQQNNWLQI